MLQLGSYSIEDSILRAAMQFFIEADLPYGPVSETKAKAIIKRCIDVTEETSVLICWVVDNEVKGLIAGQLTEVLFNENLVATELIFWVDPAYRKGVAGAQLLNAFQYWAEFRGCNFIQMVGLQNDYSKALDRYYKKQGFHLSESTYIKELT